MTTRIVRLDPICQCKLVDLLLAPSNSRSAVLQNLRVFSFTSTLNSILQQRFLHALCPVKGQSCVLDRVLPPIETCRQYPFLSL